MPTVACDRPPAWLAANPFMKPNYPTLTIERRGKFSGQTPKWPITHAQLRTVVVREIASDKQQILSTMTAVEAQSLAFRLISELEAQHKFIDKITKVTMKANTLLDTILP